MVACVNSSKRGSIKLLTDTSKKQYGLAEHVLIKCEKCKYEKGACTRRRIERDVNVRSVHASQGMCHSGLRKCCASMDLTTPITRKPYSNITKHLCEKSKNIAEK